MKTKHILAAVLALPLLAGCNKELESVPTGPRFLRACIEQPSETRVSFDSDGKFSWNTGDLIAVHVGTSFVTNVAIENPETGAFTVAETAGNQRNFYAVYPSDAAVEDNALKVKYPAAYDIRDIVSGAGDPSDAYRRGEDYSPTPMVAVNETDQDIVYFRHVGGLLRIRCDKVPAGVKTAKVTFDKAVTGTYPVNTAHPKDPTATTGEGSGAGNVVTFTISDAGVAADSYFVLNIPVPCGTYDTVQIDLLGDSATPLLARTYTGSPLRFARHHGKLLFIGDSDDVFEFVLGEFQEVTTEYAGGAKELSESFVSYKTDGSFSEAVPFVLEYSLDGTTGWDTTPRPDWLLLGGNTDFNGSTSGQVVRVDITAQENQAQDPHAEELRSRPVQTQRLDLSLVNVATGVTATSAAAGRETANCYVVSRPGNYSFPLAYGNAMIKQTINEPAFRGHRGTFDDAHMIPDDGEGLTAGSPWRTSTSSGHAHKQGYWGYFRDHLGAYIKDAWIFNQYKIADGHSYEVKLLWEDVEGLVTNISFNGDDCHYVYFTVAKETIAQGNALIGVFVDGKIAWSWHIWVTDLDLTAVKEGSNGYKFMPVNIGWVDTKDLQIYPERAIYVRARQPESGKKSAAVLVTSRGGKTVTMGGHCPSYNWGRKDPLSDNYIRTEGRITMDVTLARPEYYPTGGSYLPTESWGDWRPISTVIQHPYVRYSYTGPDAHGWNWLDTFVTNLWNSSLEIHGLPSLNAPVQKTVYDPSPVGFKVPPQAAYDDFTDDVFTWYTNEDGEGRNYKGRIDFPLYNSTETANYWSASQVENPGEDFRTAYRLRYTREFTYLYSGKTPEVISAVRPVTE